MELEFRQVQIEYLHSAAYETIVQDCSGEAIVPDTMPDMDRIADAFAGAVLRGEECQDDALTLTGDIQAGVLYAAAGEDELRQLSVYIPFTVRRPVPTDQCRYTVQCRVKSVDARMLNSRKVSVRVGLCLTLRIWCPETQTCFCPGTTDRRAQLKCTQYPMRLARECARKNVLLRDSLPLSGGQPEPARIVYAAADAALTDEKLSGDQAVCRGELRLRLLYETPDGDLASGDLSLPFSQLIELERSYEEQGLEIVPVLTALEVLAEGGGVTVEAGVCLQCIVTQTVTVPVVEDAYALRGSLEFETQTVALRPLLDERTLHQELREELPANAERIVRAEILPDAPQAETDADVCRIRVPVLIRALYCDSQGAYRQAERRTELSLELPAAQALCRAQAQVDGPVFCVPGAGRIEVRAPITVRVHWYDETPLRSVCAATLTEGPREDRPAVIIRTLETDGVLWDIAKELRTTVSAIQIANDTEADTVPAGTMLLIPIMA